MTNIEERAQLPVLSQNILKTLLYSDIFSYPLTAKEIYQSCGQAGIDMEALEIELKNLVATNYLMKIGIYFSLKNDIATIEKRIRGNTLAKKHLPTAYKMSKFIAHFPFVRGICLSGSMSKNVMAEDGDIDYFIVTKPKRLWVARTFLVLFKKVFLLNSHKYFCVNYFIDEESLEIEEKNLFTATEIVTLIPTYNTALYKAFQTANEWRKTHYPNYPLRNTEAVWNGNGGSIKKTLEYLLNGRFGNWLDAFFMEKTVNHWEKKFPHFDKAQFDVALKSRKGVSKHHPNNFQQRVLKAHRAKIQAFEEMHGVCLNAVIV